MMAEQEKYSSGYDKTLVEQLEKRRLSQKAAFLLPHLQEGMQVLDCGCGPGSLTRGFAELLAPTRVIGLDIDLGQVTLARDTSLEHKNLSFGQASVYQLPFADASFDLVFAHAVLYHLQKPEDALREMCRVLRSGGLVAIRDTDFAGSIDYPSQALITRASELLQQTIEHYGGNPHFGREQRTVLRNVGFEDVLISASYDVFQTAEEVAGIADFLVNHFAKEDIRALFFEHGWTNQAELDAIQAALIKWKDNPEAFSMHCRIEALAWKR